VSDQQYQIRTGTELVRVHDGTELSVLIYRPDSADRFPCLLTYTPYRKGSGLGDSFAGFAARGYVVVIYDVRGTGDSAGACDSIYSDEERADGYFMVEWCARQAWCDGKVGMWGISFGAVVALQMAAAAPPSLKAVIARSGTDDPYADWTNPGGSPRNYIYEMYAPFMAARNFAPPDPEVWGDRWQEVWRERLERSAPWGASFAEHLDDGPFWRVRAVREKLDQIRCPIFVVEGWADWYATPMLEIFGRLRGPKRALIGPWSHQWPHNALPGPRIDWEREALRWWDCWLKDIDTGITKEPPLTIFVKEFSQPLSSKAIETGSFRSADRWPIAGTQSGVYYFESAGRLSREEPGGSSDEDRADSVAYEPAAGSHAGKHGGGPFRYNCLLPRDQRAEELKSQIYTTDVLSESMTLIGRPRALLYVSSTEPIAQMTVSLCDVAPDGTSVLITRGFLNLAAREYPRQRPSRLSQGEIYKIELLLLACAYAIPAGHRLRIMLAGADFLNMWPAPRAFVNTVHRSRSYPSNVILPLVPGEIGSQPPSLQVLTNDPAPTLPPVVFRIGEDIVNRTVVYEFENLVLFGNRGKFEVSLDDCANATIDAEATYVCKYGTDEFVVRATCCTNSTVDTFRHQTEIEITMNGVKYWAKNWSTEVSRSFF